eukprot:1064612-Rhodomonas_salina.1
MDPLQICLHATTALVAAGCYAADLLHNPPRFRHKQSTAAHVSLRHAIHKQSTAAHVSPRHSIVILAQHTVVTTVLTTSAPVRQHSTALAPNDSSKREMHWAEGKRRGHHSGVTDASMVS